MPSGGVTPGGGGGPAAGSYLPTGDSTGVTVATGTDPISGDPMHVLTFPGSQSALALKLAGDAFPRFMLISQQQNEGLYFGDGTVNPRATGSEIYINGTDLKLAPAATGAVGFDSPIYGAAAIGPNYFPRTDQVSPLNTITSGALPTQAFVSGVGARVSTSRDVETVTPATFNPGAATTATCKVELSPDNVTYSTLGIETEPAGVAFDGTIHLIKVRVPAGWYLKLTVTNAVLGTTTYY